MNKIFAMNGIGLVGAGPSIAEDLLTIYHRGDRVAAISGGLATAMNGAQRRAKLDEALPSLAILALYQWIPSGATGGVGYKEIQQMYSSPYDYLKNLPAVVANKRTLSFQSFWDFGDWAGIKVEVDLFPKLKTLLTQRLGMDPQQWWIKQLVGAAISGDEIGDIGLMAPGQTYGGTPGTTAQPPTLLSSLTAAASAVSPFAAVATGALSFVKNLFGGTDFQWKHGLPETWSPVDSDWNGYRVNPLRGLDTSYNAGVQTGSNTTALTPSGGGSNPVFNPLLNAGIITPSYQGNYTPGTVLTNPGDGSITKVFDPNYGLWRGSDGNFYNASGAITDSQGTVLNSGGGLLSNLFNPGPSQPGLQTASTSTNMWLTIGLVSAAAIFLFKRAGK